MLRVFVYGTLKPGQVNYDRYCGDRILQALPAQVRGRLFHLSLGYPGMTSGDAWVQGYLLQFADESALLALDRLEDYQPQRPEAHNEYQRREAEVFGQDGRSLGFAWAYFMTPQKIQEYDGKWIASGVWHLEF
ncbi:gamma-glutamylcyclotransferase [Altericista sp. CCNU0014]|uniref:gamma-glutamylcyclotransferase family protein n=1 Tax=Altericista sp. CCNU0014 TaxID=3082949 RepID=UPI0038504B6F